MARHLGADMGYVFQLNKLLSVSLDGNWIDKIALGLVTLDANAIDIFLIAEALNRSRRSRHAMFSKQLGGLFYRQCVAGCVATQRVMARYVVVMTKGDIAFHNVLKLYHIEYLHDMLNDV